MLSLYVDPEPDPYRSGYNVTCAVDGCENRRYVQPTYIRNGIGRTCSNACGGILKRKWESREAAREANQQLPCANGCGRTRSSGNALCATCLKEANEALPCENGCGRNRSGSFSRCLECHVEDNEALPCENGCGRNRSGASKTCLQCRIETNEAKPCDNGCGRNRDGVLRKCRECHISDNEALPCENECGRNRRTTSSKCWECYYEENRDRLLRNAHAYNALERNRPTDRDDASDQQMYEFWGDEVCPLCGDPYIDGDTRLCPSVEHIHALIHADSPGDVPHNVMPCHKGCNSSVGTKTTVEWAEANGKPELIAKIKQWQKVARPTKTVSCFTQMQQQPGLDVLVVTRDYDDEDFDEFVDWISVIELESEDLYGLAYMPPKWFGFHVWCDTELVERDNGSTVPSEDLYDLIDAEIGGEFDAAA